MNPLLEIVAGSLDQSTIRRIGAQVGATPAQAGAAIETALPLLVGALQRNVASPGGASALLGALDRDHDGSILDDLAGFLGQGSSASADRSLDHIFGGKRGPIEGAVAKRSGLDGAQVMQILAMLAPLVLGALGKLRQQGTVQGGGGLGDILGGAMGKMQQQSPGLGGLLGGLLDSDGDGSFVDDLLEKGLGGGKASGTSGGLGELGGLLGGLLGGKRG